MQIAMPGGKQVRVPWGFIAGFGAAAIVGLAVALLMTLVFSGPSDEQLLAKAMMGDQGAAAELQERYPQAVTDEDIDAAFERSVERIYGSAGDVVKEIFTPGKFTTPNLNATDGPETVASFILLMAQDREKEALAFMANPNGSSNNLGSIRSHASAWKGTLERVFISGRALAAHTGSTPVPLESSDKIWPGNYWVTAHLDLGGTTLQAYTMGVNYLGDGRWVIP